MKKVLILAYDFPPYVSVAGLRPKSWFEELNKNGFYPIVITRQWSNKHKGPLDYVEASDSAETIVETLEHGVIIRTPYKPNLSNRLLLKHGESKYKLIRKGVTAFFELSQFYFTIGPKAQLFKGANQYLSKEKVDFIIATGEPFVLFNYAKKLGKKFETPWIADYRDVWSGIFEKQGMPLLRKFYEAQEKRIVPHARAVTTVSSFVEKNIYKNTGHKNINIFPNGFDSDSMEKANLIAQKSDVLRIGMAGSILTWNATEPFLKAVSKFNSDHPEKSIEFHFFGLNIQVQFEDLINNKYPEIKPLFTIHPKIPNTELHLKLSEFNALLLFNNFSLMGTKIYDYIGLKRQILLCFSDDEEGMKIKSEFFPTIEIGSESDSLQQDLIEKTNSGIVLTDQDHFVKVLNDLYSEHQSSGVIKCDSKNAPDYSRKIQVKKLAVLLNELGSE